MPILGAKGLKVNPKEGSPMAFKESEPRKPEGDVAVLEAPETPASAHPPGPERLTDEARVEQEEALWLATTYRGDREPELTLRALIPGILLGVVIASYNIYMGLKTGWGEGGSILAAILGFAIMRAFRQKYSVLENNLTQTTASASATVGNAMNLIAAFFLMGIVISGWRVFAWLLCMSVLGIFFAVPLRRQLVVAEKLVFPSGTACASLITTMHSKGQEGMRKATALLTAGGIAGLVTWLRDAPFLGALRVPPQFYFEWLRVRIAGFTSRELMLGVEASPLVLGAGFLVGPRVGVSLGIGAIVSWAFLAPWLVRSGIVDGLGYRSIAGWTMWVGSAVLVSASVTSMLLRWRLVTRALGSVGRAREHRLGSLEMAGRTWLFGFLAAAAVVVAVLNITLGIPVWMGALSIVISFFLAMVVVRATGETDIAPLGATGHITQMVYGGLAPGQVPVNLGTGIVTAGSAGESADLMQDLKTGYLLGATPKRQVVGQIVGVLVGALVAVPVFLLLVDAHGLGTEKLPAVAAVVWSNFARMLSDGFRVLPRYAALGAGIGVIFGVLLGIVQRTRLGRWAPSPVGLGVGMIFPGFQGLTLMIGGLARAAVDRLWPRWSDRYAYLMAAGLIAGEGLIAITIAILIERGIIG